MIHSNTLVYDENGNVREFNLKQMSINTKVFLLGNVQDEISRLEFDEEKDKCPQMNEIILELSKKQKNSNNIFSSSFYRKLVAEYLSFPFENEVSNTYLFAYKDPSKIWRDAGNYLLEISSYCEKVEAVRRLKSKLKDTEAAIKSDLGIK